MPVSLQNLGDELLPGLYKNREIFDMNRVYEIAKKRISENLYRSIRVSPGEMVRVSPIEPPIAPPVAPPVFSLEEIEQAKKFIEECSSNGRS